MKGFWLVLAALSLALAGCAQNEGSTVPTPGPRNDTPSASMTPGSSTVARPTPSVAAVVSEPLPFNAGGLLAGTASPRLPDGEAGEVSVVQIGAPYAGGLVGTTQLPFAFRNNTGASISSVEWTATARYRGAIVATGSSRGTAPAQVKSGEIGLAFIYFSGGAEIPTEGVEYEFLVKTSPVDQRSTSRAPLQVTEANRSGDAIVGSAVNATTKSVSGPYSVHVYCFDADRLLIERGDVAEQYDRAVPGDQVTFSVGLQGARCPSFTVGVQGFFVS